MTEIDALRASGLTRRFGGLAAVDHVDLSISRSERRGIIGPNGAGKTTLFRLLSGELRASEGTVSLFGDDVTRAPAHRRARLGMGRTYQITNIFLGLSVRKNVELGVLRSCRLSYAPVWGSRRAQVDRRVEEVLAVAGLSEIAEVPANSVSHGEQRQIELAIALISQPKLLLLDEPAAGLSATERARMAQTIRELPRDITICLIEHDMDFALGLCDTVTCLHYGKVIGTGSPDEIRADEDVRDVYLGRRGGR